jgi:prolyl-tRNA synthetase
MLRIIRQELESVDAQEMIAPTLHPRELWEETNRAASASFELMGLKDRRDREFVLGGTAEEMFVDLVRQFDLGERELPFCLYQFSTKFRDELRARGGLLRAREFLMKDAYSFHASSNSLDSYYEAMGAAYQRIFARFGLTTLRVASDNGMMGGEVSHEFLVEHATGESIFLTDGAGGAPIHQEIASVKFEHLNSSEPLRERTVQEAARGPTIADGISLYKEPAWRQIKSLVYRLDDGAYVLVALRGDREVNESKLKKVLGAKPFRLATEQEVLGLGSVVGFVSPLNKTIRTIGDTSLVSVRNFYTGADRLHQDTLNVTYGRDFTCDLLADLSVAVKDDLSPEGNRYQEKRGIEVGNIFKLGTYYSERMKRAVFTSSVGVRENLIMGCYGIGIGRTLQTIAELHHDERGLRWPKAVAPFDCHLVELQEADDLGGERWYTELGKHGASVLRDDRDLRAGVKFSDSDLIGSTYRVVLSKRSLERGGVEVRERTGTESKIVSLEELLTLLSGSGVLDR